MLARPVTTCLGWLLALAAVLLATPASARPGEVTYASTCHAASGAEVTVAAMAAGSARWNCSARGWDNTRPVAWLRFDARQWRPGELPMGFVSHITRFSRIAVSAVDADGTIRTSSLAESAVEPLETGPLFTVPLPSLRSDTRAVIVRIDRPHNLTVLTEARLAPQPHLAGWPASAVALLAIIAGMLIIPLVYDISFYSVLRERFLLLHTLMVVSMIGYLLFSGGLALAFVSLPIGGVAAAGPIFFAGGAAASAFFLLDFLERDAIPPRLRWLLRASAWWSALVPGTLALQLDAFQPFDNLGYFAGFAPVLAVFVATLAVALARRSQAARLVAIAWIPMLLCSAERMLRGSGLYTAPSSLDRLMFVAFALEVFTVWLAVSKRFMQMKLDRDKARLEARVLGELSERDPLTGLMNRRAMQTRFAQLHAAGYETVAVLDLDRFKTINDRFGHGVGDDVLRACAKGLSDVPGVLAIRMGGEEFMLLLRGLDGLDKAEQIRRSLPRHIAAAVEGLGERVTASMGAVQIPRSVMPEARFDEIYERADKLLYEAKAAGRDRTMSERLKAFVPRRVERRKAAA